MESKAKEMLTRGTGKFINCTDYDDAIKAMEEYKNSCLQDAIKKIEVTMEETRSDSSTFSGRAYLRAIEILKNQING